MHLPVVDFQSPTAPQDFCKCLHETGFGVLRNHPLNQSLVEGIYAEWLAFFKTDAKNKYSQDPVRMDGYFSPAVSETAKTAMSDVSSPVLQLVLLSKGEFLDQIS